MKLFALFVTTPAKQICKKLPHVKYTTYKKHDNLHWMYRDVIS